MRRLLAIPLALALLAGCSSGDDDEATTTTTTSTSTTSTTVATTTTTALDGATDAQRAGGSATGGTFLGDLTVTGGPGVDRVTFVLDDESAPGLPQVDVAYVDNPTQDGSGAPVDVDGAAYLEVRLTPASTVDLRGETPVPIYDGPDVVPGGAAKNVTEVVEAGDFEAVLSWVIGLRAEAPFRIRTAEDPAQVVVEIGTPGL